ncbi:MAG: protein O-mannosyl-transferase family [Bacteroidota bacterium]
MFSYNTIKYLTASLIGLAVFSVYCLTMAPTIGFIDSGELSTVAVSLGIAHPTGYPLFTLITKIWSSLPVAQAMIVRLNIFAAFATSISVVIFFFTVISIIDDGTKGNKWSALAAASISSMFIGFSRTFWFQGLAIEVYSLHLLLIMTDLLLFVNALKFRSYNHWLLFAFMVGLSFTNHLTTILLAPAMLYWFFADHGFNRASFKKIGILAAPFIAGLSLYLYLPVRALQQPLLNWGNPQTAERFWWHFTGKQFRIFMFSSTEAAQRQLNYFFNNLTNEFFFPVLILAGIGAVVLLFNERRKFVFISLLLVTCVAYSVNYDIHDIDSYFLLAFISIGFFASFGIRLLLDRFDGGVARGITASVLLIIAGAQLYINKGEVDQSTNYLVEDYTKNILLNLPPDAIVISYQWDYFVAASYYYQYVNGLRPDVTVIDKELLRRSWYFAQLEKMHPDLSRRSQKEIQLFLVELYKFEHDLPYDFTVIESRYTQLLNSFIQKNPDRTIFITPEIETQYTAGFIRIPEGLVLRLSTDTLYHPISDPEIQFRNFSGTDSYSRQITMLTRNALLLRAQYEEVHGKSIPAQFYLKKASEIPIKY